MRKGSKLFNLNHILYNGDYIINRRSLELVRAISGILLLIYVVVAIMVQALGIRGSIDAETVTLIQSWLDVPTMLVLVIYAGLTIRQEIFKPKYNWPAKKRPQVDWALSILGIAILATLLIVKYWV